MSGRPRIVVASPHIAECDTLADWLSSDGFEPVRAATVADAAEAVKACAFDLLIADVGFAYRDGLDTLARLRRRNAQAPTIVIGDSTTAQMQADLRNAMYLARPVDRATLSCTISMAMMDDRPVRRSLRKTVNRFEAVVDGRPSHIIDVSLEGLRLEVPRDRRASPAPYFSVRVPIIGVALLVQRMWANARPTAVRDEVAWYGAALSRNSAKVDAAWRNFVGALPTAPARPGPMPAPLR